ncbi:MAG TPA: hypothetical protein PKC43_11085 [Phycisphaerales bacterium]|nr:hypothetical protein [Phycisphaerales bacterium]HMP37977.1 hypothetical protein [Phycisphaerales bacterium]
MRSPRSGDPAAAARPADRAGAARLVPAVAPRTAVGFAPARFLAGAAGGAAERVFFADAAGFSAVPVLRLDAPSFADAAAPPALPELLRVAFFAAVFRAMTTHSLTM